jgi:hypothetical protein
MKSITECKCQNATKKLLKALDRVEQVAQAIRWRIVNFPGDLAALDVEIVRLTGESFVIAKLNGEIAALKDLERIDEAEGHECDSCGFGLLERCGECLCHLCEDCRHEFGDGFLCDECHDFLADEEVDIESDTVSDNEGKDTDKDAISNSFRSVALAA